MSLVLRVQVEWIAGAALASHFKDAPTASKRLSSVGLNDVHSWLKPHAVLSEGEKFRANVARKLETGVWSAKTRIDLLLT